MTVASHLSADACRVDPAFPAIKDTIVARTGMAFYRDRDDALTRAVAARIAALALADCEAYRRYLLDAGHATEWDTLIDEVTIGETYFFRYPAQFDALRQVVVPDLVDRKRERRSLRIWSAGCASGPEPYSIAILLQLDLAHLVEGWDISIVGTDISRGKLARATSGDFSDWELRQLPERYRHACFDRIGANWRIRDIFKRQISFKAHNLLDACAPGPFDLILCRNVMIYFDSETIRELVRTLHRSLDDNGWLVVGHAEPHLEIANLFHPWPLPETTLYRKWTDRPVAPVPSSGLAPVARPPLLRPPSAKPPPWSPPVLAEPPLAAPVFESVARTAAAPAPAGPAANGRDAAAATQDAAALAEARHRANAGDWPTATALCRRLIERRPLDADAHYLLGLIRGHQGDSGAVEPLRQALYIDRLFALAHYQLGRAAADAGDLAVARRALRNALMVLDGMADDVPVRGGEGLTASELRELTRLQIQHLGARR